MAKISIPKVFSEGQVLTGADIDANFDAFRVLFDVNGLDQTNFRQQAGITNDRKAYPMAWNPISATIQQWYIAQASAYKFSGFIAYEHYAEYPADPVTTFPSVNNGSISIANSVQDPFGVEIDSLVMIMGGYSGSHTPQNGDTLSAALTFRTPASGGLVSGGSLVLTSDNPPVAGKIYTLPNLGIRDADYVQVDLTYTPASAAERLLYNVTVIAFLKCPHVT